MGKDLQKVVKNKNEIIKQGGDKDLQVRELSEKTGELENKLVRTQNEKKIAEGKLRASEAQLSASKGQEAAVKHIIEKNPEQATEFLKNINNLKKYVKGI